MSQELGTLVLELRAEVAGFKKALADAKGDVQNFHGEVQRATRESRGAIQLLGEEIGVRLPRHVVSFLNTLPGVASAMSLAFAPAAVIALGSALVTGAEKLYKFAQGLTELSKAEKARHDQVVADAREELHYQEDLLRAHYAVLKAEATTPAQKRILQSEEDVELYNLAAASQEKLIADQKELIKLRDEQLRVTTAGFAPAAVTYAPGLGLGESLAGATLPGPRAGSKAEAYEAETEKLQKQVNLITAAMQTSYAKQLDDEKANASALAKAAEEARKKAAHDQLEGFEAELAQSKAFYGDFQENEIHFWEVKLNKATTYSENYKAIWSKLYSFMTAIQKDSLSGVGKVLRRYRPAGHRRRAPLR